MLPGTTSLVSMPAPSTVVGVLELGQGEQMLTLSLGNPLQN